MAVHRAEEVEVLFERVAHLTGKEFDLTDDWMDVVKELCESLEEVRRHYD